ncbi:MULTISPECIES: LysE family translocator [Rhodobacterales]|uniref:LysE family translocator n=1 Tax=Roseobacter sp. N2S TaxID=2663844 RepID=UPI0028631BBB|nr:MULTISPECIES: LysE family translocator [Rhodobacterales]MDR6265318.1 threonine/homoserine/homoserine lactone efflux protein [Roseobacter sp. N2S]
MSVATVTFLAFAASQVGTPGPANMALLATGARYGLRASLRFVAGVAVGKQLIIWPIGFGLMGLATQVPLLFTALKFISAAYIIWLAWKVANLKLTPGRAAGAAPGFAAGLIVHPLNPKAWAMITAGFTNFVEPGTPTLQATAIIAACLFACQVVLHPLWCWGGDRLAATVAGKPAERWLMWALAALTVLSVLFVLVQGG